MGPSSSNSVHKPRENSEVLHNPTLDDSHITLVETSLLGNSESESQNSSTEQYASLSSPEFEESTTPAFSPIPLAAPQPPVGLHAISFLSIPLDQFVTPMNIAPRCPVCGPAWNHPFCPVQRCMTPEIESSYQLETLYRPFLDDVSSPFDVGELSTESRAPSLCLPDATQLQNDDFPKKGPTTKHPELYTSVDDSYSFLHLLTPSSSWSSEVELSLEDNTSYPSSFLAMITPPPSWSYQFASVAGDEDELDDIVARLGGLKLSDEPVERFIELDL
jgi:hypothetical protein